MSYSYIFTQRALKDINILKKSGQKSILKKLYILLDELSEHPRSGTGKPEELKHEFSGLWSRRLDQKNRLVYKIEEDEKEEVIVIAVLGHYKDINLAKDLLG